MGTCGVWAALLAWSATASPATANRLYLPVALDAPSFLATIYARLVDGEDGAHNLIWSCSKGG